MPRTRRSVAATVAAADEETKGTTAVSTSSKRANQRGKRARTTQSDTSNTADTTQQQQQQQRQQQQQQQQQQSMAADTEEKRADDTRGKAAVAEEANQASSGQSGEADAAQKDDNGQDFSNGERGRKRKRYQKAKKDKMATQQEQETDEMNGEAAVAEEANQAASSTAEEAEAKEEINSDESDNDNNKRTKRKRDKKAQGESLADVSNLPVDVTGASFMLMGDVDRSVCEGLIYQHGAVVSKQVLKKQQYVIAGPAKSTHWRGGSTGPGTRIWAEAKQARKTFISQHTFERWMERVQVAKDDAEKEAHAADEHLVQALLEATSLPEVLINLVAEYAVEEAPILPIFRQWLKFENRASDGAHSSSLPPPASDEQIADVEERLKTRLPFALRQLLRLHNGASLVGDSAGMRVFPSTDDMLAYRPQRELYTAPLRWLMLQRNLDKSRTPHGTKYLYFVPPIGPLVTPTSHVEWRVVAESIDQFMQQYVDMWKSNIDAGEEHEQQQEGKEGQGQAEEERKGGEGSRATDNEEAAESKQETEGSATKSLRDAEPLTAAASEPLSSHARFVAACRPSALSVLCMQQEWPTLSGTYPRVWRQAAAAQGRGHVKLKQWSDRLNTWQVTDDY